MSRIYFHSPSGDAELFGSERAWLRHVARGPAEAAWNIDVSGTIDRAKAILDLVPEVPEGAHGANYLHRYLREAVAQERANKAAYEGWRPGEALRGLTSHEPQRQMIRALRTSLNVDGLRMVVAGVELHTTNIEMNTALAAGSDPVKLAAKIDGWCEGHAWVEGGERAWLADIIDQGLRSGIYRRTLRRGDQPDGELQSQGWGQVLELLRARDDEPVVMSYSVCDQFPNPQIAEPLAVPDVLDGREDADDQWYKLPPDEQWETAMTGLRRERPWARLAPDTLAEQTFGIPVTVYDLFAPDRDERVRAAANLAEATA